MLEPITIDFETRGIVGNPLVNPPRPVGVAVWVPGYEPTYMSWDHPTENNCSWYDAERYLGKIAQETDQPILFHNAGFDLSVWEAEFINAYFTHKPEQWRRWHDTMYLLFLADPYSSTLSLKPSADRYLGMAPTEQLAVREWILAHVPDATSKNWGAYICLAPGELVGRYAVGDVVRTRGLFDLLHKKIVDDGMEAAYDRERRLFPITLAGTRHGIRIDRDTLHHHESVYTDCLKIANSRLVSTLGATEAILESDDALADALEKSGAVKEWVLTPKSGKRSMSKENMKIEIPEVKVLMDYKGALETCLQTFMRPWLEFSKDDGRLHPNWNQVKQPKDDTAWSKKKGTQTGRLSSDSPNFQNVPTEFTDKLGVALAVPQGLHPLPQMRRYCLPEEGHLWLKRDFSSQEIRILAHFEDGVLCAAYKANPSLDPHQMAREMIHSIVGLMYARKDIKITGFSIIYGSGATGLSHQLGRTIEESFKIRSAYLAAMPGVKDLMDTVQRRGKSGGAIRTWGGRLYYAEPAKVVGGRFRSFEYKLLNYLIQGSAADQTKESIIEWGETKSWEAIFLATVHDEINISAPREEWQRHMAHLKEAMNRDRLDVPMLSDGFVGENWADIEEAA